MVVTTKVKLYCHDQNPPRVFVHTGAQQCFVVFDVLMVNDTNLANCPLKERAEQLKK